MSAGGQRAGGGGGDLRQSLFWMMLWVALVHAAFIGVYVVADLEVAAPRLRTIFTVTWTAATFVVVTIFLRRIRRLRGQMRKRR